MKLILEILEAPACKGVTCHIAVQGLGQASPIEMAAGALLKQAVLQVLPQVGSALGSRGTIVTTGNPQNQ